VRLDAVRQWAERRVEPRTDVEAAPTRESKARGWGNGRE